MKLSIIIPVYNEEAAIKQVLEKVGRVKILGVKKEVIVVDDGSTDDSFRIITRLKGKDSRFMILRQEHLGKGAAVRCGFKHATGGVIVIQDADLELDPGEYRTMLEQVYSRGAGAVYGSRFMQNNPGVPRVSRLANWGLTKLTNFLFGVKLTDMETAYKMLRREVVAKVAGKLRCAGFEFEPEVTARILQAGFAIVEVPIEYRPRDKKAGKHIGWQDGLTAVYTLLRCRFL